ncbi:NADH dehydrogenase [ubiquinone] 1 alpha subcomplex assembly factor 3 [Madurella mycetomatis]|uniref:NADH dehydrogenase [ubiquinone] 1 alpha subcomplex assembly factor 3 n=1 Tax=Madurella mycetomatis TaxID=100816 RepID=A0A175W933_9PEZI|nr:NADH dehydrogenase [ubiquinone] 1 alpha subcomplex assembly factor 3 [Madurella mycetomatis]
MATQSPAAAVAAIRLSAVSCRALRRTASAATKPRRYSSQPATPSPPLIPRQRRPQLSPAATSRSSSSIQTPNGAPALASFHSTPQDPRQRRPLAHNREPVPDQPPPTDFGRMDVLGETPAPATAVKVCHRRWLLAAGRGRAVGGRGRGAAWRGGEVVCVAAGGRGWGQWEVGEEGFALLGVLWPRPDLLILGVGPEIRPLSPATRRIISNLGMRVEVLDTRNAASQYNMLATERGWGMLRPR